MILMKSDVLEWLWDHIAEPILSTLGFTSRAEDGSWPRICWIPTGLLVGLPLHAAGYHGSSGHNTVMDRVISSYSISVAALAGAQEKGVAQCGDRKPERAVFIGMKELRHAPREIQQVAKICKSMQVKTPTPVAKDVLQALRDCDIFHFAGHGSSSPQDPSQSALILASKERLTVSNLFEINLYQRKPFLAFLSACSTGRVKAEKLIDEGLHLIAACQVAGFRHVIGTMWEVNDASCIRAAEIVYEHMQMHRMTDESVSEGMHKASRKLRDEWKRGGERRTRCSVAGQDSEDREETRNVVSAEEGPLLWVPYVHYGI